MADIDELHRRLEEIGNKIRAAKALAEEKAAWTKTNELTAEELMRRHAYLEKQLESEVADLEAEGLHVTELEKSVLAWIDGIELETR
ncbi:MAG: 3-ketoacyl-ACP reductase [Alphaproteobacteria bacterium]|nr:MAG: 3-ketoacyl-ACP reductase [Alphaproteobacteria bacterium]